MHLCCLSCLYVAELQVLMQWSSTQAKCSVQDIQDAMEVDQSNTDNTNPLLAPRTVKFEVQVYRTKAHQYLVDVQRLEGHLYLYLDLCGDLLSIIKAAEDAAHFNQGQQWTQHM